MTEDARLKWASMQTNGRYLDNNLQQILQPFQIVNRKLATQTTKQPLTQNIYKPQTVNARLCVDNVDAKVGAASDAGSRGAEGAAAPSSGDGL